jgi:SAM-dependent methyltransferase
VSLGLSRQYIQARDAVSTHDRYGIWEGIIPLPPDSLLFSVGGASLELWLVLSDAFHQVFVRHLPLCSVVLDIGCGCGRSARLLVPHTAVKTYIGFDVIVENIVWCQRFIQERFPTKAIFYHYDVTSAEYNPNGTMHAHDVRFPAENGTVDLVIATSLFTHLLEDDAKHYLAEIARVLNSVGRAIITIHTSVAEGVTFSGNEHRIDIAPSFFIEMAARSGLTQAGGIFELGGQDVLVFRKAQPPS